MNAKKYTGDLSSLVEDAVDDDRLYFARFRTPGMNDTERDGLEKAVAREAEKIEQTVGCVTFVDRMDVGRIGPNEPVDIVLYAILPRHTDKELFDCVIAEARHRALERTHD